MEQCAVCGKQFKTRSGLSGHMQFSHPTAGPVAGAALEALRSEVGALRQVVAQALDDSARAVAVREGNNVSEEVMTKKDFEIERLRGELLEAQAQRAMPSVRAFIRHCESGECDGQHQQQWDQYKAKVVQAAWDSIPDNEVRKLLCARDIVPKRVVFPDGASEETKTALIGLLNEITRER